MFVRVHLRDGGGISEVVLKGVAVRGDPDLGAELGEVRLLERTITFDVPVRDTTISRYLRSTDDPGTDRVLLMVSATDVAGNVGADTVEVGVGGPSVTIRTPVPGQVVRAGTQVPIEVHASDPEGVNLIAISFAGALEQTVQFVFAAVQDTVLRTMLSLPASTGELEIAAFARNSDGVTNRSRVIKVQVSSASGADTQAPRVGLQVLAPARVELTDSIRVRVTARDEDGGTGVASVAFTALARSAGAGVDMLWHRSHTFPTVRADEAVHEFKIPIAELYATVGADFAAGLSLPEPLQFEVHGIAVDAAGNCAAATGTALAQIPCATITMNGVTAPVAANTIGQRADVAVVAGRTVKLSGGGVIADAVVDRGRRQLYLSNFTLNRVEKLDLQTLTFLAGGIPVGSQPWGLFLDNSGDSLIVANSGGTNLDFVPLNAAGLPMPCVPVSACRFQTPNVLLFQILQQEDEGGVVRYTSEAIGFSDRPQFVAQDIDGALLYSTLPTRTAGDGTVRRAWIEPGWERPEVELILSDVIVENPDAFAIAGVDSVTACTGFLNGVVVASGIRIYDRIPGTRTPITTDCLHPVAAAAEAAQKGSRVDLRQRVEWDRSRIGLSDTTFVAASGDRRRIVFGEGAVNTGRIIMWYAEEKRGSNLIEVTDLIQNEPARITGVDLNRDGTLGIARGTAGAYFFNESLRLWGRAVEGVGGGAGGAMYPDHVGTGPGLSFVGTDRNSIQILDVNHFTSRGEIPIRDQVVGPLRVSLPLAGDPADTVVRIYAVTSAGGVVLVRVRQSDILP
jgi:DNA-binding beta-propeller fold protein YncE